MSSGHAPVTTGRVTISLVTFNGLAWLPGCIASIRAQTLRPIEILIIDNASTDGTADWLRMQAEADETMVFEESPRNLGFAKAHNRNIFAARGEFVCLLNQDLELDERFLEEAVEPFALDARIAAVQGRLRRLARPGVRVSVLDSTGLVMRRDRRAVSRSQGEEDRSSHAADGPVWGADGPAPVYRRSALMDARVPATRGGWEVLDEDFFMYKEDVDLAWRLRNLGWTAWYAPAALAWHARGAQSLRGVAGALAVRRSVPTWVTAVSWRNQRLLLIKNETVLGFLRHLPWILPRELAAFLWMLSAPRRDETLGSLLRRLLLAIRKRRYLHRLGSRGNDSAAKRWPHRDA
jgi:GT2 family glycosyltransferase